MERVPPGLGPGEHVAKFARRDRSERREPGAESGVLVDRLGKSAQSRVKPGMGRRGPGVGAPSGEPSEHQLTLKCAPPASTSAAIEPRATTILRTSFIVTFLSGG